MRRCAPLGLAAVATALAAATLAPAQAISGGSDDDGRHPMVGTMVAQDDDGEPLWRCSGTLVSSTVLVTSPRLPAGLLALGRHNRLLQ